MKMNPFTVEEMNLLAIYNGESKEEVTEKIAFALSFMDSDMRELASLTLINNSWDTSQWTKVGNTWKLINGLNGGSSAILKLVFTVKYRNLCKGLS